MASVDKTEFSVLRRNMVEFQLAGRGIKDACVLGVFSVVPREKFVAAENAAEAYDDHPLPIGFGQTISQPYMVALMTECLRLEGKERVLEVGPGSGYQTAVLSKLAREVYTVERIETLSKSAAKVLAGLGHRNVHFRVGDGSLGWPEAAPFDRVLVTAGAPGVPEPLFGQLVDGGLLVIPIGSESEQELIVVEKIGNRRVERHVCYCHFVKLIGKEGWQVSEE
jgi:protein-L-isoaspartate(D-aspartate) O-methyltransferase